MAERLASVGWRADLIRFDLVVGFKNAEDHTSLAVILAGSRWLAKSAIEHSHRTAPLSIRKKNSLGTTFRLALI